METVKRRLGLLLCGALAVTSIWACAATRNKDGSWTFEFAPDMTLTTYGLEDALGKLTDLLDKCITGNFSRPCTQAEMDAISDVIEKVLERKSRMGDPQSPGSGGDVPAPC